MGLDFRSFGSTGGVDQARPAERGFSTNSLDTKDTVLMAQLAVRQHIQEQVDSVQEDIELTHGGALRRRMRSAKVGMCSSLCCFH